MTREELNHLASTVHAQGEAIDCMIEAQQLMIDALREITEKMEQS